MTITDEGALLNQEPVSEDTSDGFHTFRELYEHRNALTAALYGTWSRDARWKARLHDDGTMFEGFFLVGIQMGQRLVGGGYVPNVITYHIPLTLWDCFGGPELDLAPAWDGHTPANVVSQLLTYAMRRARE